MFVCLCNNVTEKDIKEFMTDKDVTLSEVCKELNIGCQCGKCVEQAKEVYENDKLART